MQLERTTAWLAEFLVEGRGAADLTARKMVATNREEGFPIPLLGCQESRCEVVIANLCRLSAEVNAGAPTGCRF